MSAAGLPGPSGRELGFRFNLVSLLPTSLLVLFILVLIQSGAVTGRPQLNRLGPDQLLQRGLNLGGLLYLSAVVTLVALVLYPFQMQMVRVFEGYWSGRSRLARAARSIGQEVQRRRLEVHYVHQDLPAVDERLNLAPNVVRRAEAERDRRVQAALSAFPSRDHRLLPTRLGNMLRATEDTVGKPFGLNAVTVWPWLYPHVGERHARALDETRSQLDAYVRLSVAMLLATLIGAGVLATDGVWLIVPAFTLLFAWLSYRAAVLTAAKYGRGIEVAFDLYRFDMLRAMHFPLPENLDQERHFNKHLMKFLDGRMPINGSDAEHRYQHESAADAIRQSAPPDGSDGGVETDTT